MLSMECSIRSYVVSCPKCKLTASLEFEVTRSGFLKPIPDRKFRMQDFGARSLLVHVPCGQACVILSMAKA